VSPTKPCPQAPRPGRGAALAPARRAGRWVREGADKMAEAGGGGPGAGCERSSAEPPPPPQSPPAEGKALSAAEYARRVHQWLWDSYCGYLSWQSGLPALLAASAAASAAPQPPAPAAAGGAAATAAASAASTAAYYSPFYLLAPAWPQAAGSRPGPTPRAAPGSATAPREPAGRPAGEWGTPIWVTLTISLTGREFLIPSLAHRFIAEMVDFFILFFIKATIVLSIMHLSGIKDISKFAMHYIIEEIDEDTSMEDLQKMMVVALIYRLLVCFYEIICIWGAGGATPGKFLLGLRVVTCDTSVLVAPSRVLVIPSSNVSMTTSTIRALIKNFSIASFFPAFITLLFFQHNRTAYDIVAGTIVVRRNGIR
uniref:Family with sequence similarity 8 member A1 n=1 Tax=Anas platyrhynchos platyrhynchos TaxID=8840 RepID=A0A493T1B6_ANAPP